MLNVIAAATRPNNTCLKPENHTDLPVNKVMAEPIKNKPAALAITLMTMAMKPLIKKKGNTGMMAPIEKSIKE